MPTENGYNIGQDNRIVIVDSVQGRIDFTIQTSFDSHEVTATTKVRPMRGPALQDEIPEGWEGSFDIDRASAALDTYIAKRAQIFYATNQLSTASMYQYVDEVGGGRSVFEYTRVTFKLGDAGKYGGGEVVKQKVSFFASERRKVA
jgi:hypothetical protein